MFNKWKNRNMRVNLLGLGKKKRIKRECKGFRQKN